MIFSIDKNKIKLIKIIIFIVQMSFCGCNGDKRIEGNYKNLEYKDTVRLVITEYPQEKIRKFNEEYFIKRTSIHYVDKFIYKKNIGLFRKYEMPSPLIMGNSCLDLKDCLWIQDFSFHVSPTDFDENKKYPLISYSDRDYRDIWRRKDISNRIVNPEENLNTLHDVRFDSVFSDTIRKI